MLSQNGIKAVGNWILMSSIEVRGCCRRYTTNLGFVFDEQVNAVFR